MNYELLGEIPMKNKIIKFAISLGVAAVVSGCNSEIDMVKNGTLQGYEQTTVGKAIESVFGEVEWTYFETEKGVRVVEAKGWPGKQMFGFGGILYERYGSYSFELEPYCVEPQKMVIQFTLHTNSNLFDVSYCSLEKDMISRNYCNAIINYMYRNDAKYEPMKEMCDGVLAKKAEKEAKKARIEEEKRKAEEIRKNLMNEAMSSLKFFTDPRDKNVYKTVKIGKQRWLANNLNLATQNSHCYQDNNENCERYGRLYMWDEAMKVCPSGWHLPSRAEFDTLVSIAGSAVALRSMRREGDEDWHSQLGDFGGTDDFGFTMLPAGAALYDGQERRYYWKNLHTIGYFWSSTEIDYEVIGYENMTWGYRSKKHYFSVRCVMDDNPEVEKQLVEPEYDLE